MNTPIAPVAPAIDMRPPAKASSMVAAAGYDPTNLVLRVQYYGNGGAYDYLGVSQEIADGLHNAESPGRFMQQWIKGQYDSRRREPEAAPEAAAQAEQP